MSRRVITTDTAQQVKDLLWRGRRQSEIAAILGVSQGLVSRIRKGLAFSDLPWPNGTSGPMPSPSHLPISRELDWSVDAKRYLSYQAEMQQRVLDVVNTRRRDLGLDMIPSSAPEYADYIAMEPDDAAFESLRLNEARKAEDRRIACIMREFDEITIDEITESRNRAAQAILEATREDRTDEVIQESANPPQYDKIEWAMVKRSTAVPVVLEAMATNDVVLKESICILFKRLKTDLWGTAAVAREAHAIAERLRRYPQLVEKLEQEYGGDEI